ncbi:hypothetical protein C2W62_48905, partial [Candidatus Entotheonella serta]
SLCRFARSVRFAENFFYELAQLNVSVCFADLPTYDDTDDKEVMRRQMDEVWAEYDRKRIIQRLKAGREARAKTGKMSGGTCHMAIKAIHRLGRRPEGDSDCRARSHDHTHYLQTTRPEHSRHRHYRRTQYPRIPLT